MDEHANRVLAYMAQSADEGSELKPGGKAELIAYLESNCAVAHSTTGFCVTFGGAATSYGSKRQHCILLSSTEAEIVAASHTAAEVIYLRGLLAEMGHDRPRCRSTTAEWSSCPRSAARVSARDMLID
eukprot:4828562-Pleurochrysis_carterae.AAC.1